MRLLFIHQNLPGQFRHLLAWYAARPDCQVVGIGEQRRVRENAGNLPSGMELIGYELPTRRPSATHAYLRSTEAAVVRGQQVARTLLALKKRGFVPDIIYAHPGWGEALYIKDVFPATPLLCFGEFFYGADGRDFGFDPEFPGDFDGRLKLRTRNMQQLLSMEAADAIISPTEWQKASLPTALQAKVCVVHDGIDTCKVAPNASASIHLARDNLTLTAQDEVITFVNRNLEPYRGFHIFMRALPELLQRRPNAQVIIVGGDEVSYGQRPSTGSYRQQMLAELQGKLDMRRIHFVGKLPYATYLNLLQVSTAHVYLTYPFVLSWSMLEAMAAGCLVVGSRTAPVSEVLRDGENGLLVDFFSPAEIVEAVCRVCEHPERMADLRKAARAEVKRDFDLHGVCLPKQVALIEHLASSRTPSSTLN